MPTTPDKRVANVVPADPNQWRETPPYPALEVEIEEVHDE